MVNDMSLQVKLQVYSGKMNDVVLLEYILIITICVKLIFICMVLTDLN